MKYEDYQLKWFMYNTTSLIHTPYRWGGDDPTGFDCSGMVIDGLRSCGVLKSDFDTTADGLFHRFKHKRIVGESQEGDLLFWFVRDKAVHVAVALDCYFCITADGGGSKTETLDDAIKQNAFIKIRPIDHRSTHPKIVRIF